MAANGGEKQRFFCHSCGGVTTYLTPEEAAEERAHGHDIEAWPPAPEAGTESA